MLNLNYDAILIRLIRVMKKGRFRFMMVRMFSILFFNFRLNEVERRREGEVKDMPLMFMIQIYKYLFIDMNNQGSIEIIRSAINVFIIIAIAISLFQEFNFGSSTSPATAGQQKPSAPQINENGTKVEGLVILTSDSFRSKFRDLMIQKNYSIQMKEYPF